jgi:hypothetical protein
MPGMNISINEGWADIPELQRNDKLVDLTGNNAPFIEAVLIDGGMASGAASVILRMKLPDGKVLVAETSLALFLSAADVMRAAHGGQGDVN